MNSNTAFSSVISSFTNKKILVIGESMLDFYVFGKAERICREGPVPIVATTHVEYAAGGAANAAINLASLGASVSFLSVIGNDFEGEKVTEILHNFSIDTKGIQKDPQRKTISKKRIYGFSQLLIRVDDGTESAITPEFEEKLIAYLTNIYDSFDAILVSDYGYGIVTENILYTLLKLQHAFPRICVVDAKKINKYRDFPATMIKPNYEEALSFLHIGEKAYGNERIGQILSMKDQFISQLAADIIAITLDKEGALILKKNGKSYRTYSNTVTGSKAIGAGDTYASAFTLALLSDANVDSAAEIAGAAAQVVIKKDQTAYCRQEELEQQLYSSGKYIRDKDFLVQIMAKAREEGKRIVFTNGCFDILHTGHVTYLNKAKQLGDMLVVAVNSDDSVKRLKGKSRPINSLLDRINVLSALSCVDYIVDFSQDTPVDLIKKIKPQIYVKGGDYKRDTLPETKTVEENGGKVEIIPLVHNKSTTKIVDKISTNYIKQQHI